MDFILNAADERDLYAMKAYRYEKLVGRGEDHSLRVSGPWRAIVRREGDGTRRKIVIVDVEDYH